MKTVTKMMNLYKYITQHKEKLIKVFFTLMVLWVLVGFVLYPALKTLETSFTDGNGFTWSNYQQFFSSETSVMALKNTIVLGVSTVVVCGIIGTLLAFYTGFFDFPFKKWIHRLLLMPMMLPGLIIVISFVQLYGESGLVTKSLEWLLGLEQAPYSFTGFSGILFVHAYTQYVYFYISVSVAIRHIDYSVVEAAQNLGATRTKIFFSVILPFIAPALIASSIITFMSGIGSFSAPSIIGGSYKVMTTQILLSKANNYMGMAATQVVLLTLVAMVYLVLVRYYEKKRYFTTSVKGIAMKPVRIRQKWLGALFSAVSLLLVLFIVLPVLTIVFLSFVKPGSWMIEIFPTEFSLDNYIKIFTKSRALEPFVNSIRMSLQAALFGALVAVPCSYIIVKSGHRMKGVIEFLVMLPWIMPASAIAINTINAFNEPNIFAFNQVLVGTSILLPLAYFVSALPLMVRTTNISLYNLNDTFQEASKSLGADWFYTFRKITIPIIMPGIMAGILLGFIRSVGEYTTSVFLYTVSNRPVSIAMVNAVFEYEIGLAMAYGTLVIIITSIISTQVSKFSDVSNTGI